MISEKKDDGKELKMAFLWTIWSITLQNFTLEKGIDHHIPPDIA